MSFAKSAGLFCLESLVFSVILVYVWGGVSSFSAHRDRNAAAEDDAKTQARIELYDAQLARTVQQQEVSEQQLRRADEMLALQESNQRRFSAVLSVWEGQVGIKR